MNSTGVRRGVVHAYSFGLIDLLQRWIPLQEISGSLKGYFWRYNEKERSTVEPVFYADRMLSYLENRVFLSEDDYVKSKTRHILESAHSKTIELSDTPRENSEGHGIPLILNFPKEEALKL